MLLSIEEIEKATSRNLVNRDRLKAYFILVDNKIFVTDKGKMTWKSKGYAKMAFKLALEPLLMQSVKNKLLSQGMKSSQIYGESEFLRAFDNYMRYLENNNMFQIVRLI